ncbi:MAG: 50S ribosomal protein L25/general stress protein Ctc [Pseudomonadota bacterium]
MAEAIELKAWSRGRTGTGGARAIRREGRIPGIVYGGSDEPLNISLETKEVSKQIQTGHFQSTVYMLDMDGKKIRAIPRDVQVDPVRDFPMHVDFLRLAKNAMVDVDVPVHFQNEAASPGLKRGGILNIVRHEISLRCLADSIPESIQIDLTGLEIGESIHISAVTLPEGATPTIADRDFTVATIAGRGADDSAEEEGAEEAEDEAEAEEKTEE